MLLDVAMMMLDKLETELRKAEPEKRERFIQKAVSLLELSAEEIIK
ncbi:MAG: hypothetical protein ACOYJ1_09065 [Peptococcales bacterium]